MPAIFAKSAIDIGLNFSAADPSALTEPPENSTWSGLSSQSLAARAQSSVLICLAASTIAIEPENAERLPPVRKVKPSEPVSPMIGRTLS